MLVPDLSARVTLLDRDEKCAGWQAEKFLHSHDACCDAASNSFVAEWVHTSRITKLRKLA
ncbi:MAG: hypothetical protein NTX09_16430 [Verrucomicrobia bacterium]|nr:hypothetical protein [Verrucomicrobiota bacterium]